MLRSLRHHPATYWVAAGVLALLTATACWSMLRGATAARSAWGETRAVPVVVRAVAAGERLAPADLDLRLLPKALLPDAPVADDPVGATAAVPLAAGEVVLASRLIGAAALPPGTVGVAIDRRLVGLELTVGSVVTLLPTRTGAAGADGIGPAPAAGTVVGVDDDAVTIALATTDATRLAAAVRDGDLVVALGAPGPSAGPPPPTSGAAR